MFLRTIYGVVCCAVMLNLCGGVPTASAADDATDPSVPINLSKSEARIQEALDEDTTFDFQETPLREAIEFLKNFHKVEIQIDHKTLFEAGAETDLRITRSLKGVTLRSGLKLMLRDHDLTYIIKDEVVLITTPDVAERTSVTCLYDVKQLLDDGESADSIAKLLSTILDTTSKRATAKDGVAAKDVASTKRASSRITSFKQRLIVRGPQSLQDNVQQILRGLADIERQFGKPRHRLEKRSTKQPKNEPPPPKSPNMNPAELDDDPFKTSDGDDPFG